MQYFKIILTKSSSYYYNNNFAALQAMHGIGPVSIETRCELVGTKYEMIYSFTEANSKVLQDNAARELTAAKLHCYFDSGFDVHKYR